MLNQNTITLLSQINNITNSAIIKYPVSVFNNSSGDMYVHADISALDSDEFKEFGVYDIGEFLNTFKLFDADRKVSIDGSTLNISGGNATVQYNTTNLTLLQDFNKDVSVFDKTEAVPTVSEFVLTSDDIKKIKQASGVFKDLTEIQLTSQDGDMQIALSASNKFNASSNKFGLTKESESSKEFTIGINAENFNKLPGIDYNVYVKYNSKVDSYRVMLASPEIEGFKILLAVNK